MGTGFLFNLSWVVIARNFIRRIAVPGGSGGSKEQRNAADGEAAEGKSNPATLM
jgi:hypothetical protein